MDTTTAPRRSHKQTSIPSIPLVNLLLTTKKKFWPGSKGKPEGDTGETSMTAIPVPIPDTGSHHSDSTDKNKPHNKSSTISEHSTITSSLASTTSLLLPTTTVFSSAPLMDTSAPLFNRIFNSYQRSAHISGGPHLSTLAIASLASGAACIIVALFIIIKVCPRPGRRTPTPSLPILEDGFDDIYKPGVEDSPLFGGKERISHLDINGFSPWPKDLQAPQWPPEPVQTFDPPPILPLTGCKGGKWITPSTDMRTARAPTMNPTLPHRDLFAECRMLSLKLPAGYRQPHSTQVGIRLRKQPALMITPVAVAEPSPAHGGRSRIKSSYFTSYPRSSAAPMSASAGALIHLESSGASLHRSESRRDRDTKALAAALGLPSPSPICPPPPSPTIHPDDSLSMGRRFSKTIPSRSADSAAGGMQSPDIRYLQGARPQC
ncbi:nucleotide-sugar transporter-domain-containing protein [Salix suchowensis]|nr:nucleotide-sugar transporter-domain-containing protein [Salix suchowensis]